MNMTDLKHKIDVCKQFLLDHDIPSEIVGHIVGGLSFSAMGELYDEVVYYQRMNEEADRHIMHVFDELLNPNGVTDK